MENNGVLPLKSKGNIALYGNGARHTIKGGTGSGDVNSRTVVSIEEGFEAAGFTVTSKGWLGRYDDSLKNHQEKYLERIKKKSEELGMPEGMVMFADPIGIPPIPPITEHDVVESNTDTAVYVLSRDSGEGGDRFFTQKDYLLSDDEIKDIRKIASSYENAIVLLNVGGIIDVSTISAIEGIGAIVNVSQLGNMGGHVVADVITGKSDPSGRLTDTWAMRYEDYPCWSGFSHNNGDTDDEFYREGIYVGYRYFDTFKIEPKYPFGYGLGYTKFDWDFKSASLDGSRYTATVGVTNVGEYDGKDVVQLYVSAPYGNIDKPYQELRAYAKTPLIKAGESADVTLTFDMKDCASYDTGSACMILEKGDYLVRIGSDSRSTFVASVISLSEDVIVSRHKNLFKADVEFEELINPLLARDEEDITEAEKLTLDPKSIETVTFDYVTERHLLEDRRSGEHLTFDDVLAGKATVEELTAQLTVEEMAKLAVGAYESDALMQSNVIGSASLLVPGAAAETTDKLYDSRKIPLMILADGPAGLRLQPHFKADAQGNRIMGGEVFGMAFNPFPEDLPEDHVDYYQYCTAIPIATALAQSWNNDLIELCGKIVGEEMKKYFVHLWLAPGMNIHRNPLCGRNFEYYSEDPLISGNCAAADTIGVQSWGGQGTTIKHFACNNQEDNRMYSNSHVSEKTLRELYLKGFEIAVKKSQPYSIMTSYNLLNGTHTANNFDLIQSMARDEWGFEGVVMTDWYTSQEADFMGPPSDKYPCSSSPLCIRAGNDLQMPGCEKNVTDIIDAVNDGSLPLADLQFCICNALKITARCFA
ncbi:MAG: glycoside hydrolase family 3 C-terminal domain-containing protein [Clostridiales bacterium]|nr:glycoside hydrolase family 3 C-terminal domain-containing protein [Clostridiales bacterium]